MPLRPARLLVVASILLAVPCSAWAQDEEPALWSGAEGVGQALGDLFAQCDAAMAEGALGYADNTMCLAVARVIPGPTATVVFSATAGQEYTVLVAGDANAADSVTVTVTDADADGQSIGEPSDKVDGAVCFSRAEQGPVMVGVSIPYAEDAPAACCAIAILEEGGDKASSDAFAQAFGKLIATLGAAEAELGAELGLHGNDNFAVYGAVLPANQGGVALGVTLEPGPHILLSAGDASTPQVSCDFSDGGVESYGYSGQMDDVAVVGYTPEEPTYVAPMAGSGSEQQSVLMWMLLDGPGE